MYYSRFHWLHIDNFWKDKAALMTGSLSEMYYYCLLLLPSCMCKNLDVDYHLLVDLSNIFCKILNVKILSLENLVIYVIVASIENGFSQFNKGRYKGSYASLFM